MDPLRGVALAPAAAEWLAHSTAARILNVFERACNLISADGTVLALVTSARGMGPFTLVVDGDGGAPFRGLPAESPVRLLPSKQALCVGPLRIEYGDAAAWDARPDWPAVARHYRQNPNSLPWLAVAAAGVDVAGSLLDLYRPATGSTALERVLRAAAQQGAEALVGGLAAGDEIQATRGAQSLAGLGGGLTPAGDDFVVGVLLAAWAGLYGPSGGQLAGAVAEAAAPRTTTLSAAYLRAAARGECIVPWHDLFAALLRGDAASTQAAVAALVSVGHTSGADALAGFVAVLYALGGSSTRPAGG
jgi:hypothetical protein